MPPQSPSRFTMIPLRKSSEPTATRRARIIMACGMVAALTGPVAVALSLSTMNQPVDFSSVSPQGRSLADAVAAQALTPDTVKVPTARSFDPSNARPPVEYPRAEESLPYAVDSLSWTGFQLNTFEGGDRSTSFEVHTYLLVPDLTDFLAEVEEDSAGDPDDVDGDGDGEDPEATIEVENTSASTEDPDAEEGGGDSDDEENAGDDDGDTEDDGSGEDEVPDEDAESPTPTPQPGSEEEEREAIIADGVIPYQLEVPILLTDDGPRVAGAPSIAPWTPSAASPEGDGDYSNFSSLRAEPSTQTARQVGKWAVAYAEGDEETLLSLTGDTDPNHRYLGLGGWQIPDNNSAVQILHAINVNDGNQLLRVRVLMEDARADVGSEENRFRMYSDFDVLISGPASATPQVVAWGAAGAGASLSPYKNAVDIR